MSSIKQKLLEKTENMEPKGFSWLLIVLFLILLSTAVIFFSGSNNYKTAVEDQKTGQINSRIPRAYSVFYTNGVFSPTNLRIHAGDTVEFQNKTFFPIRIAANNQGVLSQTFGFQSSGSIASDGVFSFTFSSVGIFNYYNERDPNEAGTIIVK